MSEWQPIETAPKDGTRILVIDEYKDQYVVKWMVDYEVVFPTDPCEAEAMKEWCIPESYQDEQGGYFTIDPVAWMPLPEPPAQEQ
jgi:hypothetical protein